MSTSGPNGIAGLWPALDRALTTGSMQKLALQDAQDARLKEDTGNWASRILMGPGTGAVGSRDLAQPNFQSLPKLPDGSPDLMAIQAPKPAAAAPLMSAGNQQGLLNNVISPKTQLETLIGTAAANAKPYDLAEGASRFVGNRIIATNPKAPPKADLVTLKMPDGSSKSFDTTTQQAAIGAAIAAGGTEVKTPLSQVNLNNSQEGKFDSTMGEGLAKEYMNIQNQGRSGADASSRLDYLGSLLSGVNTGAGANSILGLKQAAKRVGIDLDAMGVKDDVAAAQAANMITNQMALDLRSTANGAGMPGAMSDSDRNFLMSMPAGIEKDHAANPVILDYWKRVKQREVETAQWARDYKKQNGGKYDEGFYDYAAKKAAEKPLFAGAKMPGKPAVASGAPTQIKGEADYNALPSGSSYLDPQGVLRTKK